MGIVYPLPPMQGFYWQGIASIRATLRQQIMAEKETEKKKDPARIPGMKVRGIPYTHGLYTEIDINTIDRRTKLGITIKNLQKQLREYVGQTTTASELLIHRVVYKTIKLSLYESFSLENIEHKEADHYLPMANSLRLDLVALASMAGKPKAPDLNEYINAKYGDNKK